MGIEFEVKFRTDPETLQAIAKEVSGEEQIYRMKTTYYDTPTRQLSLRHYTLRLRMENDRAVCTLKTPAAGWGRQEFEVNATAIEDALPELCKLSGVQELPRLLREGIAPLCGAEFTRIARQVCFQGSVLELALDEGVLTGGGRKMPLCEVEVELKEGSEDAALEYAKTLAGRYGLAQEKRSKFSRAKALAEGVEDNGV